jgi:hypothetical protein
MTDVVRRPTGTRYSASVAIRARELYDAGWAVRRIRELLAKEMAPLAPPSHTTVHSWVSPKRQQSQARAKARYAEKQARDAEARFGSPRHLPGYRAARARRLCEQGLSVVAVAKVMAYDYAEPPLSREQMSRVLESGEWPA